MKIINQFMKAMELISLDSCWQSYWCNSTVYGVIISVRQTYARKRKRPRKIVAAEDIAEEDNSDNDERDEAQGQQSESKVGMDEDEDSSATIAATRGAFQLNDDWLN
jgi:hypothetical protein